MPSDDSDSTAETAFRVKGGSDPRKPRRFDPGTLLGNRYRIVASLGAGGMGEVFRADDLRLGQSVALKFLPGDLAADSSMLQRLTTEVRIGRLISHPNVCRLYDLVEDEGVAFVAMEFIDGEDLASLLRRIGRLPPDKVLSLAQDIVAGLAAAHDRGVVHRDLKPGNVMVDERGVARIADFGLAVELGQEHGRAGTPAYMAPEQLAGQKVGPETDLYAMGLVIWEALTGRRLFEGGTIESIRSQHGKGITRPSSWVEGIEPGMEEVVLACLEENPRSRPGSAREVLEALRRASGKPTSPSPPSLPRSSGLGGSDRDQRISIAVLPFEELTSNDDDSFAVGLAEEIIGDLAKIRKLRVISRGSVMRFQGTQSCRPVALELGVRYVLNGSIRRAGNRLRVTAHLVDGEDESLVWSEKFQGTLDDIFEIQEGIAHSIAERFEIELSAEETEQIAQRTIDDPVAYGYYLRARERIWKWNEADLDAAIVDLEKARERIGDNILLLSTLGMAWWQLFNSGIRAESACLQQAEQHANRIFELDPHSYHGHRLLGMICVSRGDAHNAILHLRRVVEWEPQDTDSLWWLGVLYTITGLSDLARPLARQALEVDPLGSMTQFLPAVIDWHEGQFDRAAEQIRRCHLVDSDSPLFFYSLWLMLMHGGHLDEASLLTEMLPQMEDSFIPRVLRFQKAAIDGDRTEVERLAALLDEPCRKDLQYSVFMAEGWALTGEDDRALEWLERAKDLGYVAYEFLAKHDRFLDSLRPNPLFQELLRQIRVEHDQLRASLRDS